jgi:hypothetical protein
MAEEVTNRWLSRRHSDSEGRERLWEFLHDQGGEGLTSVLEKKRGVLAQWLTKRWWGGGYLAAVRPWCDDAPVDGGWRLWLAKILCGAGDHLDLLTWEGEQ